LTDKINLRCIKLQHPLSEDEMELGIGGGRVAAPIGADKVSP